MQTVSQSNQTIPSRGGGHGEDYALLREILVGGVHIARDKNARITAQPGLASEPGLSGKGGSGDTRQKGMAQPR